MAAERLSRSERETHICRASDQDHWAIFSDDPTVIRKLTRLHGEGEPTGAWGGMRWKIPKRCVSFRNPKKKAGKKAKSATPPAAVD